MSTPYIVLTKKQPVIIGYVCSRCKNPIIATVTAQAEATRHYSFSRTMAEEQAEQDAEKAILFEINRIEKCKDEHTALDVVINKPSRLAYGHWCESKLVGINTHCPNCLNLEPWQFFMPLGIGKLEEQNFPIVFAKIEEAEHWAHKKVDEIIQSMDDSNVGSDDLKKECAFLYVRIQNLTQKRETLPEKSERDNLTAQKETQEEEKKKLGLFDFKGRKIVKRKIDDLFSQIQEISSIIREKEKSLSEDIHACQMRLQSIQPLAYGYTGKKLMKKRFRSIVFMAQPRAISQESIEIYRSRTTITPQKVPVQESEQLPPEVETSNIFCRKCGFKLLSNSKFCSKCGCEIRKE